MEYNRIPLNRAAEFARFIEKISYNNVLRGFFPNGLIVNIPYKDADEGFLWDSGIDFERSTSRKIVVFGSLGSNGYGGNREIIIDVSKPPRGFYVEISGGNSAAKAFLAAEKLRKVR